MEAWVYSSWGLKYVTKLNVSFDIITSIVFLCSIWCKFLHLDSSIMIFILFLESLTLICTLWWWGRLIAINNLPIKPLMIQTTSFENLHEACDAIVVIIHWNALCWFEWPLALSTFVITYLSTKTQVQTLVDHHS